MKVEIEPMQQALNQVLARGQTVSEQLVILEDLIHFLKKHAPELLVRSEADFYPVVKAVGRRHS